VIVCNALALFFAGVEVREDKQEIELRVEIQTQNLARAIDQSVSAKTEKIDLFLRMVVRELEKGLAAGEIDKQLIRDRFGPQNQFLSEAGPLRVTDSQGTVIIGGQNEGPPSSYASRDYYLHLRDHPGAGLYIAKPVMGYLTRRWIVPFALPYRQGGADNPARYRPGSDRQPPLSFGDPPRDRRSQCFAGTQEAGCLGRPADDFSRHAAL
jgi:hypothetical protein